MPKTPIDKDCHPLSSKYEIRLSHKIVIATPPGDFFTTKHHNKGFFRRLISPGLDLRHDPRPLRTFDCVSDINHPMEVLPMSRRALGSYFVIIQCACGILRISNLSAYNGYFNIVELCSLCNIESDIPRVD